MTRTGSLLLLVVVALVGLGLPLTAQSGQKYTARLGWVPIDGATRAGITGKGSVTGTLSGSALTINGTYDGLSSPATIARLHRGVATGARGNAIGDLTVTKGTSGTIAGKITLTPPQVEDLKAGRLYVQLHSEKGVQPDGANLWGWLLP